MDVDEEANTYMGQGVETKSASLSSLPLPRQLTYPVHTHYSGFTSIETSTSPDMHMFIFMYLVKLPQCEPRVRKFNYRIYTCMYTHAYGIRTGRTEDSTVFSSPS